MSEEESIDLTPGIVWEEAQLIVVRDLAARVHRAEAAVRRVRELHKGVCNWDAPECEECSWSDDDGCSYFAPSPCPTLRALDGETPSAAPHRAERGEAPQAPGRAGQNGSGRSVAIPGHVSEGEL